LESLLDVYPWSSEALALYGTVVAATRHCFSPRANLRLYEWVAGWQAATNRPSEISEDVERFAVMRDWMAGWLRTHDWMGSSQGPSIVSHQEGSVGQPWARVLDVAAADGAMAVHWLKVPGVASVTCLDLTYLHCRQGHDHRGHLANLHFVRATGDHLPAADSSYDVVVLAGILEHVLSPAAFVAEAARVLRPGGLLLVQTPYGGTGHRETDPQGHPLPFRFHVNCIDPTALGEGWATLLHSHFIDYTNSIQAPHSFDGTYCDFAVAYEKRVVPS
jgi:SAM-dependent methyltransferase